MTGRVIIDLLKVVQREYKLQSYKLDNVASHFIRDKISNICGLDDNQTKIFTFF
jgi:DNA polymerase elongation subunit (family B)